MASYKKYAENLIGDWNKDIYEPQKDVTKAIYQTNWNKLTNDYNTVRDKLARNFELARNEYANTLNDVQNASFNRMNNANIDLASRGLSSSGMLDLINQGDTQTKGTDVDKALAALLKTNNASLEGLREDVIGLGENQSKLAGDLSGDIAGLTDADAKNNQQYGDLVAGIAQSAAGRAASRSGSGSRKTKEDKNLEEMYRTLGIIQTLNDDSLSDDEKRFVLTSEYDVDVKKSINAINGYNNNKLLDKTNSQINKISNRLPGWNAMNADWTAFANKPSTPLTLRTAMNIFNVPNAASYYENQRLDKLRNKINGLTYSDLNEILFGNK